MHYLLKSHISCHVKYNLHKFFLFYLSAPFCQNKLENITEINYTGVGQIKKNYKKIFKNK